MSRNRGLTLVELLVGLIIISIVFVFCMSLGSSFYGKNQLQMLENEISLAIRFTRNMALLYHLPLILTPLANSEDWSEGMLLLMDNEKHQYTGTEEIIHQWNWQKKGIRVSWQGFYSHNYLLFSPELNRSASNGHFTLSNNEGMRIQLVINRLGRIVKPSIPSPSAQAGGLKGSCSTE